MIQYPKEQREQGQGGKPGPHPGQDLLAMGAAKLALERFTELELRETRVELARCGRVLGVARDESETHHRSVIGDGALR